jgi:hypothetical protein
MARGRVCTVTAHETAAVDDRITFLQETEDTCGWRIPV